MRNIAFSACLMSLIYCAANAGESVEFSNIKTSETPITIKDWSQKAMPILSGFYPDPSAIKVGDYYYLVNSTFSFFPGIPVFRSKDMINWEQIGNAIDRPNMLPMKNIGTSRGVFAPDISYHDGVFYIVNTCVDCGGNFIISAKDPKGPWSDPIWLNEVDGIDPSLFFDNGKAYIINNGGPSYAPLYEGHRAIWIQEFDLKTMKPFGPRSVIIDGGTDLAKKPVWIEGPHIYKKNDYYYLMAAEGGTAENHSEVIFRSKSVLGPYIPWEKNPILTQRDLDEKRANPITSTGHASLIDGPDGNIWAVFLGTRPYKDNFYNIGRETFLQKADWSGEWPVILEKGLSVKPYFGDAKYAKSKLKSFNVLKPIIKNKMEWLGIRIPEVDFYNWNKNNLVLKAQNAQIGDISKSPSFLGVRQTSTDFSFATKMKTNLKSNNYQTGLVAVQSDYNYVFCGLNIVNGKSNVEFRVREGKGDAQFGKLVDTKPISKTDNIDVKIAINSNSIKCSIDGKEFTKSIAPEVLSTAKAGGFVGTIIGPYLSAN